MAGSQYIIGDYIQKKTETNINLVIFLFTFHKLQFFLNHFRICCASNLVLIIFMESGHKSNFEKHANLKQMTTQQLKALLAKLQNQRDILEAKNQELSIQISDLRNAVKCVESERKDNVAYETEKKKELQERIDSLQKGLKYANKNDPYETMEKYKAIMEE